MADQPGIAAGSQGAGRRPARASGGRASHRDRLCAGRKRFVRRRGRQLHGDQRGHRPDAVGLRHAAGLAPPAQPGRLAVPGRRHRRTRRQPPRRGSSSSAPCRAGVRPRSGWPRCSILAWPLAIGLCLPLALLLFPDGRPPSPRWRWLIWAIAAEAVLFELMFAESGQRDDRPPDGDPVPDASRLSPAHRGVGDHQYRLGRDSSPSSSPRSWSGTVAAATPSAGSSCGCCWP